jgi:molybdate transport system substrate-binding protein
VRRLLFLLAGCALAFAVTGASYAAGTPGKITVFAAASLREAFDDAGAAFTKKTGIAVSFNYGGSDTLASQIAQGAPADVFASANETQMKKIVDAGLAAGPPATFARNRIVVIVPKNNPAKIAAVTDLAKPGVKLVLGAATVPVGSYTRATFSAMSGQNGVPAGFAAAAEKNVVSNELDVKAVAAKVSLGEADAGVVYATDVTPISAKVNVIDFPAGAAKDAVYPIVALRAAPNASGAQAFVAFILGDGQEFLRARGFIKP